MSTLESLSRIQRQLAECQEDLTDVLSSVSNLKDDTEQSESAEDSTQSEAQAILKAVFDPVHHLATSLSRLERQAIVLAGDPSKKERYDDLVNYRGSTTFKEKPDLQDVLTLLSVLAEHTINIRRLLDDVEIPNKGPNDAQ